MRNRICLVLVFGFGIAVGVYLAQPRSSVSARQPAPAATDTREADRQAIRAHIDSIFRAYINVDCKTIRATHAANWVGFTGQSRSVMRGIDIYMKNSAPFCQSAGPLTPGGGLVDYKLTDIDYEFYGDVVLVPYVAETWYGQGRNPGKLRSLDVYAKVNGEWTQVGSNIYLHPDMIQAQFQQEAEPGQLSPNQRQSLQTAREGVCRSFFKGDQA